MRLQRGGLVSTNARHPCGDSPRETQPTLHTTLVANMEPIRAPGCAHRRATRARQSLEVGKLWGRRQHGEALETSSPMHRATPRSPKRLEPLRQLTCRWNTGLGFEFARRRNVLHTDCAIRIASSRRRHAAPAPTTTLGNPPFGVLGGTRSSPRSASRAEFHRR